MRCAAHLFVFASMALGMATARADMPYPNFSQQEIATHRANINLITSTAANCLDTTWNIHIDFFNRHGVSKFYGDRRKDYNTVDKRKAVLRKLRKPEALAYEQEPLSCIGMARRCLQQGFAAAGQQAVWNKIEAKLQDEGKVYGTDLQLMLRSLGWKMIYWNPDPSQNEQWDKEDRKLVPPTPLKKYQPVWGNHAFYYAKAMRERVYSPYRMPIDDVQMLVGFGTQQPREFTAAPFFVGVAHSGYHVFPGRFGEVIEAHSMRELNSIDNLEVSQFNPLAPGGGPRWTRTEKYRSGVIVIPPTN